MIATLFSRAANFAFLATALLGIAALTAQGAGFTAGFEGQARDTIGANGNLPVGRGVGDGVWASSGLANWRELDWIPMRVNVTNTTGGPVTQTIVVNVDHASGSSPGEAGLFTFVATPDPKSALFPVGLRPDAIPTSNLADLARGLEPSA